MKTDVTPCRDDHASGALLFVRRLADLRTAVWATNALLTQWRTSASTATPVLGVLVRESIDAEVTRPTFGAGPADGHVTLRASTGVSGIWSLCTFDFQSFDGFSPFEHRRRAVLDFVLRGWGVNQERQKLAFFLPVFSETEASIGAETRLDALEDNYPTLALGRSCFIHDPACSGLQPLPSCDPSKTVRWLFDHQRRSSGGAC